MLRLILCLLAAPAMGQQVTIGTSASYPPMIIHDGAAPVSGLEGELLAMICARAGWTCNWEILPFDGLFPALETGRIDIAANSLGYSAERAARVHMTCPHRPRQSDRMTDPFFVLDPTHDPESGPIAVVRDTLHATALADAELDARLFSDDDVAIDAVVTGQIPAYFGPQPPVANHPAGGRLTAVGSFDIHSSGTSFAISPLRPDLAAEVEEHLANLSREGTLSAITNRWMGRSVEDPIALCDIQHPTS